MNIRNRKGSALLIVLGMLAFMVVSAVTFSVYMRESRAPSSHLRRASSARYLLRAALANAISRIDGVAADGVDDTNGSSDMVEGVWDDVYPGLVRKSDNTGGMSDRNGNSRGGDYWIGRVFTPFGEISSADTVSTLTLEGLAYLPPAIINEVRVASRKTRTAAWHNLAYDTGRYAFTAVNVSDMFDINKLRANTNRSSAAGGRLNLSSLVDANQASSLDTVLRKATTDQIPFISVADFNIAAGAGQFSPFCRYIGQSGSQIYNSSDVIVPNLMFITDTWFPPTNRVDGTTTFDLSAGGDNQPFRSFMDDANFTEVAKNSTITPFGQVLMRHLNGVGLACLYDYLDQDSRPISLCLPSVETVPMVCGLGLAHGGKILPRVSTTDTLTGDYGPADPVSGKKPYTRTATKYALTSLGDRFMLTGTVAYPFRRAKAKGYDTSFTGEALIRIWWGAGDCRSRLPQGVAVHPAQQGDWNTKGDGAEGVATVKVDIPSLGLNVVDDPTTEQALGSFNAPVTLPNVSMPMFWHVVEENKENGTKTEYYSLDGVKDDNNALKPRDAQAAVEKWWTEAVVGPDLKTICNGTEWTGEPKHKHTGASLNGTSYSLHLAVWVKIKDGDGDVVDMVPAGIEEDKLWGTLPGNVPDSVRKMFGSSDPSLAVPVLEFRGSDCALTYGKDVMTTLNGSTPERFSATWDRMYAVDPRWNWAPENWFCMSGGGGEAKKTEWLQQVEPLLNGGGRDRDIFMFSSDQEYLQAIGELAFLPFVGWGENDSFMEGEFLRNVSFGGASMQSRRGGAANLGQFACGNFMWRTYSPFREDAYSLYDLYDQGRPVQVLSGRGDFRANPYSEDTRIMAAVVKNTPYDYFVASTNYPFSFGSAPTLNQSLDHSFGPDGSYARRWNEETAEKIAAALRNAIRNDVVSGDGAGVDWEDTFDDLDWIGGGKGDDQRDFLGADMEYPLYGVDRKFLFSYWHECFQNRQQLFLVFLRAEPLTVGGSSGDSIANSQLGARGVALVWRDPAPPRGVRRSRDVTRDQMKNDPLANAPHRTRVLFYHQFD